MKRETLLGRQLTSALASEPYSKLEGSGAFEFARRPAACARRRGLRWGLSRAIALFFSLMLIGAASQAAESSEVLAVKGVTTPGEELIAAAEDLQKAQNLEQYVELRKIWSLWDRVNPTSVEAILELSSENKRLSNGARLYAKVLTAYARLRRGDVETAKARFRELGYITEWQIVGPFDNEGKAGFDQIFEPDAEPGAPIVPGRAYSGKQRPVRWRQLPQVFPFGFIDFSSLIRPHVQVCAFASTVVDGGQKGRLATAWFGASGASQLLFNGQEVLRDSSYRGFDVDRHSATIKLLPGQNRLTVKVCGFETAPVFSLRLGDAQGLPDVRLRSDASVEAFAAAQKNVEDVLSAQPALARHPKSLASPLELVDAIESSKGSSAQQLEIAARYLVMTRGDDVAAHQARTLLQRSVEKKPSLESLRLLSMIAEDRNAARRAVEQMRELEGANDIRVLYRQAELERSGPSPRNAFPIYDRILFADPDHLGALEGRAQLFNAAGLKRTALATLEAALQRRPHSVLLLSMVASQRSAVGRSTEAFEAEERYSSLRFDDTSYFTQRIDLGVARRDTQAAQHWLSRVQSFEPQSLWTYRLASRVHRELGQSERALVDLEQALELAPEDVGTLKSLADLKGVQGRRDEQLALLQEVLRLRPQEVEVRKYVEFIQPAAESADEKYALSPEEFLNKRHAPHGGEPRRTLQDLHVSTVYENGLSSQFRQLVFQPLTDAAAAQARQYAFQYQADSQRVQLKGARVYRSDGSVDEAIESGEGAANDPSMSMYTSARTFYIQFPRLEPGDVVELRYRIDDVTVRNEFNDYFGDVVYLQSSEPIAQAEYVLITPKSREVVVDVHLNGVEQSVEEKDDSRVYRFVAENIPALKPEANMPPWSEVLGFIHVSTYKSWQDLGRWYWGLVREQLDLDAETKALAQKIAKGASTDDEKVRAVYNWVVKNTRYVALEFGIYGFKPRRCVQTVNRGWGDCKDKATVIVTLLRELGVPANLVIVRTGMRGDFPSQLPSLAPFDHAIAYVPSLDLYLDGTAEYTGSRELPVMDQGAIGLKILDGDAELVRLPVLPASQSQISRKLEINLAKSGAAKLKFATKIQGNAAPGFRARYEAKSTLFERLSSDFGGQYPGVSIDKKSIQTSNLGELEQAVELEFQASSDQFARREGDAFSLPVTLGTRLTSRYASLSTRQSDLLIKAFGTRVEEVIIELPPGAVVEKAPPSTKGSSAFGRYEVQFEEVNGQWRVLSSIRLEPRRIEPKDYPAFRKFCLEVDRAMSHRLVVKL
ncbi:MAG: DUF3857 domain-containing protein [Polyangiaceae bacterium]|nr:DUF3857 domain-containing protein [Polyangiaceae bacterium]